MNYPENPEIMNDSDVLKKIERGDSMRWLLNGYKDLLERLYPDVDIDGFTMEDMKDFLSNETVITVFRVMDGGSVVSTAQANYIRDVPHDKARVGNVITRRGCEGRGHGMATMLALESEIRRRWPTVAYIALTNNPTKGNGSFYEKLGYTPRRDDRWPVRWLKRFLDRVGFRTQNETVVWRKKI